ncbi:MULTISPECIES: hypothetical protein [Leptolyngbya]|nr:MULTISPECIES: hypothetical protein [Leptolyngbya]
MGSPKLDSCAFVQSAEALASLLIQHVELWLGAHLAKLQSRSI